MNYSPRAEAFPAYIALARRPRSKGRGRRADVPCWLLDALDPAASGEAKIVFDFLPHTEIIAVVVAATVTPVGSDSRASEIVGLASRFVSLSAGRMSDIMGPDPLSW